MNKVYRTVFNEKTNTWVAVSEVTKAHGKSGVSGNVVSTVLDGVLFDKKMLAVSTAVAAALVSQSAMAADARIENGNAQKAIAISPGNSIVGGTGSAKAGGDASIAAGWNAKADGASTIALGVEASTETNSANYDRIKGFADKTENNIAIGRKSRSGGLQTIAVGPETIASKTQSIAFGFDALTFLLSAITLWLIRMPHIKSGDDEESSSVIDTIREGLAYVRQNPSLSSVFILIIFANVLVAAPMTVGIPVLADERLIEGAAAFGIIMSAFGGGALLGMILGGALPRPSDQRLGIVLITVWSMMGIGTALLGLASVTSTAAILSGIMGISNGYVSIVFLTWLQTNTPEAMLGRMMSLFGFSTVGLAPIANALLGGIIGWNLTLAFVGSGLLMTFFVLGAMLLNSALRHMQISTSVSA